ncbi:hypothetical protein PhCBS80983_g00310 [Powellomyces hirtus]|uniref:Uncharacterized protein n=1 Tax=Powellomyces hirtus TaxID=109895 RepID=A0A507EGJ6_9FUNG|nr:hypothetical protein PhCBS80983_g00310 [Powellomyces hirtus]
MSDFVKVLFCLYTALAYFGSLFVSAVFRIPRSRSRFISSVSMMGNTNSLPVALMYSLARDAGARLVLQPESEKDADHVARRGIAFVLFFSLFSNILRWTICYQLMAKVPEDILPPPAISYGTAAERHGVDMLDENTTAPPEEDMFPGDALCADIPDKDRTTYAKRCRRRSRLFSGPDDVQNTFTDPDATETPTEQSPLILPPEASRQSPIMEPSIAERDTSSLAHAPRPNSRWTNYRNTVIDLLNAPLYAAIFGLVIGLIPPVKNLFFSTQAGHVPLLGEVVTDPLYSLGEASVPIILLTLGGQLGSMRKHEEGRHVVTSEPLDVTLVIFLRMILTPAVALPFLWAMSGYVPLVADRTFAMGTYMNYHPALSLQHFDFRTDFFLCDKAMLILSAQPPALNVMNMSQAQRNHESITARLLFWSYLASFPILTTWVVVDLLALEQFWP